MIHLVPPHIALRMFEVAERIRPVVRDLGLLEASLSRASMTSYGQELYPGIHLKMAATLDSVNRNHPLVDGNKRLSWIVVAATYRVNGHPDPVGTVDEHESLVLEVASDHPELDRIAEQLESMFGAAEDTSDAQAGRPT
ncbi:type II toxin-antitoxin system death-on-curing family toxin [Promicromonospora thailandica]|uniref:Death on curing protein n=1 Tax=Promicromonospora thailandica TaxID=765201 RepID=A0A9X2G6Q4_9MICO|nr:Fic family protein [Promicromonospora thailandica]MCP2263561.1 death on curing protein [Promicromonospora thailandica]BFF19254.1 type II toxin-antitoxin system death-on-curing family toxin [Promicromonospora thailandica]